MSDQPRLLQGFNRVIKAFDEFARSQSFSGILLIICTLIALTVANSHWAYAYFQINHAYVGLHYESYNFEKSIQHWVNDGLMAIFFLLVGLEIKREVLAGELSAISKAALPIVAAVGGMVMPALIYFAINYHHPQSLNGWGIPMATDIAFALGVLSLVGKRLPRSLLILLSAVAIVDDLGAVLVIAIFYTSTLHYFYLGLAGLFLLILIAFNRLKVHALAPYLIVGIFLWIALLNSGIHATIAGVLLALCIPARSYYATKSVSGRLHNLVNQLDHIDQDQHGFIDSEQGKSLLQIIQNITTRVEPPLQRLEHILHRPVTYFIIPLFVLINAGVSFAGADFHAALTHPITVGIICGLVLGKALGIFGSCAALVKLKWVQLPNNVSLKMLFPLSLIAGIGFTMSIFIGELAFSGNDQMLMLAKTGILIASLIAAVVGFVLMRLTLPKVS